MTWDLTDAQIRTEGQNFMDFLTARREFIVAAVEWYAGYESPAHIEDELYFVGRAIEAGVNCIRNGAPDPQPDAEPDSADSDDADKDDGKDDDLPLLRGGAANG